jgi:DNA-binding MarR family transcriptional regulator/N-acetylglutamate synthase-like GNAT family acetyltransferase
VLITAPRPSTNVEQGIAAVRRFNRFYTQRIGLLQDGWAKSPFSLAEARVLYELMRREKPTAGEIAKELDLDAGYLSRILRGFERRGLVAKQPSPNDRRQVLLSLTARGHKAFAPLEARTRAEVAALLDSLPETEQTRLLDAMERIEGLLGGGASAAASDKSYVLRPHATGDMGWVVSRHAELYRREYGWNDEIEALTAEIVAAFLRNYDPARERCWIAERAGRKVGCVFLVKQSARVAQLRLLLVEPEARGLGIGLRLVEECVRLAQETGYRSIMLWTHSNLDAARHIYDRAGFRLVRKESYNKFGCDLVGEIWERKL